MSFMDNSFEDSEKLFRAVYPPSHSGMYWKKNGRISSSAFADPRGLSVEREYYRETAKIITKMKKQFVGCIVSLNVKNCRDVNAIVKYLPTKNNEYHSEIHGSDTTILLSKSQRYHLAEVANNEYMEL